MPDPAEQRVRRAQHPGDRRQARAAHPQRHGNRRRHRRLGPRDRLPERAREHRRRPELPREPRRVARDDRGALVTSGCRAGATSWQPIKLAKRLHLGDDDLVVTVATDGAALYESELPNGAAARLARTASTRSAAAQVFGEHLLGAAEDHLLECADSDRNRIFNLGYYTWVEQQGVPLDEFEARREQSFWRSLLDLVPVWDELIAELNGRSGALPEVSRPRARRLAAAPGDR